MKDNEEKEKRYGDAATKPDTKVAYGKRERRPHANLDPDITKSQNAAKENWGQKKSRVSYYMNERNIY